MWLLEVESYISVRMAWVFEWPLSASMHCYTAIRPPMHFMIVTKNEYNI